MFVVTRGLWACASDVVCSAGVSLTCLYLGLVPATCCLCATLCPPCVPPCVPPLCPPPCPPCAPPCVPPCVPPVLHPVPHPVSPPCPPCAPLQLQPLCCPSRAWGQLGAAHGTGWGGPHWGLRVATLPTAGPSGTAGTAGTTSDVQGFLPCLQLPP